MSTAIISTLKLKMGDGFNVPVRVATHSNVSGSIKSQGIQRKAFVNDWEARARIARNHLQAKSEDGDTGARGVKNELTIRDNNPAVGYKVKAAMIGAGAALIGTMFIL